jgi:transposase
MTRYVGLDVHKEVVQACVLDQDGRWLESRRLPCTKESLEAFARERLRAEDRVALEATTNTWAVVALLRPHVAEVVVGNPLRTRAIAEAKVKTDKIDAEVLAQLLRCDYLPRVWQPDEDTRRLRELSGQRAGLVADQTRLKNRVRSLLAQRLIVAPLPTLFGVTGRAWLQSVEVMATDRLLLDGWLRLLDGLQAEQLRVEQALAELSYPREEVRLLMTLPGVGAAAAQALVAALGDWRRFPDGDAAASYLGLTPSLRQSAGSCRHGRITKAGNPQARWLLTQAAQQVAQHPGPIGVFFRRLKARKNHNVAVVATARKLVVIAHLMLKQREPYRYALPETTRGKLAALRVAATGQRRKKSGALRAPMERRAPGVRARKTPALNAVYANEALPAAKGLAALTAGERRALERMGVLAHAARVQTPQERLERRRTAPTSKKTG